MYKTASEIADRVLVKCAAVEDVDHVKRIAGGAGVAATGGVLGALHGSAAETQEAAKAYKRVMRSAPNVNPAGGETLDWLLDRLKTQGKVEREAIEAAKRAARSSSWRHGLRGLGFGAALGTGLVGGSYLVDALRNPNK